METQEGLAAAVEDRQEEIHRTTRTGLRGQGGRWDQEAHRLQAEEDPRHHRLQVVEKQGALAGGAGTAIEDGTAAVGAIKGAVCSNSASRR